MCLRLAIASMRPVTTRSCRNTSPWATSAAVCPLRLAARKSWLLACGAREAGRGDKRAEGRQAPCAREEAHGEEAKGEEAKGEEAKGEEAKGEEAKGEEAKGEEAKGEEAHGEEAKAG